MRASPQEDEEIEAAESRADTSVSKAELSTLKRGLQALEILNEVSMINASKLAARMNLPRTTARRILDTLVAENLAEKIRYPSSYRLTPGVARLSRGLSDEIVLCHVATPLLAAVTKRVGWTFALATPQADFMVIQITTDSLSPYSIDRVNVGTRLPISRSQSGRLTIAYMPEEERSHLGDTPGDSAAPAVPDMWQDSLEQIRDRGCVYPPAVVGRRRNVVCVPVFMAGRVRAALAMNYFASAVDRKTLERDYIPMLKEVAAEIGTKAEEFRHGGSGSA